jgi:molybdopterin synthase sulfur carrier subunit
MEVLYFGAVRSRIGLAKETVDPPPGVTDVRGLVEWLRARGGGYAEGLGNLAVVRVAVNQELASLDAPVKRGDEIALFPPMTGG